ncbi:MAG: restriction endonuclease subunit S [Verrucomicrobia bacterium]|nr:restriction endonuclease subunit S [Verrucomicrobiota bacterium]
MKRWPTKTLGSFCQTGSGGTPSRGRPEYFDDGTVPWVKSGELKESVVLNTAEKITVAATKETNAGIVPKNAVLVAMYGATVGETAILGMDAATNQAVCHIIPDQNTAHFRFVWYALKSRLDELLSKRVGGAQPNISQGIIRNTVVPLPPLTEQERIVKLLDEADELRKLRAQADRRTAALFHELFGDPMDNPRGWPSCPVSSFVEELYGGRSVNPAGADEATGRFRVLKISAVTWGEFKPEESKPVSASYEPPESHFVRAGDLLFSRANTTELVAATSYVFDTPPNLLLPDKLWRFVWKQPKVVEPLFVWWLFQAPSVRRELGQRATGTGGSMKNISKPKVMSLEVPVPPLPLQKEFAERVAEIREMGAVQAASRQRIESLFQSMLHRAFNGEL